MNVGGLLCLSCADLGSLKGLEGEGGGERGLRVEGAGSSGE